MELDVIENFSGINIEVVPTHDPRQWYMTVDQAAEGYGVGRTNIMQHLHEHADELRHGIEVDAVSIPDSIGRLQSKPILFREGVIKLGFFIRSKKAAAFRQWATNLIVQHLDNAGMDIGTLLTKLETRFDGVDTRLNYIQGEVDELRELVHIVVSDSDEKEIRELIREVKKATGMDGRAIVGHVRGTLGTSGIYNTPGLNQVKNVLRNMLGRGVRLVSE